MNTIYSNYIPKEIGTPRVVVPIQESSYLPHTYYMSMVISELCMADMPTYQLKIDEIMDRLDHLISFIHDNDEVKRTALEYFHEETNVRDVLTYMQYSGLVRAHGDLVRITDSQLDYIRDYLLDYHDLD